MMGSQYTQGSLPCASLLVYEFLYLGGCRPWAFVILLREVGRATIWEKGHLENGSWEGEIEAASEI